MMRVVGLGALALVMLALAAGSARRRARLLVAWRGRGPLPPTPRIRTWLAASAFGAGVLLLALAAWDAHDAQARDGHEPLASDVVFCLDVSRSMLATDETPSRLGRAREAILALLAGESQLRAGLVLFAGEAVLGAPLTRDHRSVAVWLERAAPHSVSLGGTDLAAALRVAGAAFIAGSAAPRRILLLTDGEDHGGAGRTEATRLAESGIRIDVLPVGSARGSKIPAQQGDGLFVLDREGQEVLTRVDVRALEQLAQSGAGALYPLDVSASELGLEVRVGDSPSGGVQAWVGLCALCLLLMAGVLRRARAAWSVLLVACWLGGCGGGIERGSEAFARRQFDEALAHFQEALEGATGESRAVLSFNAALCALHAERWEVAQQRAQDAEQAAEPALRAAGATVRGCAAMARSRVHAARAQEDSGAAVEQMLALRFAEDALGAFRAAALLEPDSLSARRNAERALRWLSALRERRSVRPKIPRPRPAPASTSPKAAPSSQPEPPPPVPPPGTARPAAPPDLSPAAIGALLAQLKAKEEEKLDARRRERARRSADVEKDW